MEGKIQVLEDENNALKDENKQIRSAMRTCIPKKAIAKETIPCNLTDTTKIISGQLDKKKRKTERRKKDKFLREVFYDSTFHNLVQKYR